MTGVDRRNFLQTAGLAIAAMGIDPERLIWQPGQMVAVPGLRLPQMEWSWDGGVTWSLLPVTQVDDTFLHWATGAEIVRQRDDRQHNLYHLMSGDTIRITIKNGRDSK